MLRVGIGHPFGLRLLLASVALAMAMATLPVLEPWADRALGMAALGLAAYLATVVALARPRRRPSAPALRQVWAIREVMASRLAERQAAERAGQRSEWTRILAEALGHLDRQFLPTLEEVVHRHQALGRHLARYQRHELPAPEPAVLERLHAIHTRQQQAIAACVRQAANADAALLALTQEADEEAVVGQAQRWAEDLLVVHDALVEVLRGSDELEMLVERLR